MESRFYIGQEVVAIYDHPQGWVKKGQEFIIQGIKKGCCTIELNIGIKYDYQNYSGFMSCIYCKKREKSDGYTWFESAYFSPKQQLSETTYNEVMEWIKKGNEITILN